MLTLPDCERKSQVHKYKEPIDWERIADSPDFRRLIHSKKAFIIPALLFSFVSLFGLLVLVGFAPGFMSAKIANIPNRSYWFAICQFVVAWIIAGLYVKRAGRFDKHAKRITTPGENNKGDA